MQPKVSVIVPCYNRAAFLPKAIASLHAQTLGDWECIIVDDGSTDNTAEVAANIALNEPRVRLVQQTNGGLAAARNAGLIQAKGEYIQFLVVRCTTINVLCLLKQANLVIAKQML